MSSSAKQRNNYVANNKNHVFYYKTLKPNLGRNCQVRINNQFSYNHRIGIQNCLNRLFFFNVFNGP